MENLIQAAPIKTVVIAVFQTIGFRPTPFSQWVAVGTVLIVFPLQPVFFISRKANQLNNGVLFTKLGKILIDDSGFQFSGTPTGLRPPASFALSPLEVWGCDAWAGIQT